MKTTRTMFSVTGSMAAIERDLKVNLPKIENAALKSTAARITKRIKTELVRAVSGDVKVKQKTIRGRISVFQMKSKTGNALIKFRLADIPLEAVGNLRETTRGVRSGAQTRAGAFVGTIRIGRQAGKQTAFARVGAARYPIVRQGVEIESRGGMLAQIGNTIVTVEFPKRYRHELERRLARGGAAGVK